MSYTLLHARVWVSVYDFFSLTRYTDDIITIRCIIRVKALTKFN